MRVLLTRAAEDSVRTRAILEGLGHNVLISPVIAIEATGAGWPNGVVDAVLATSRQAFVAIGGGWGPTREARRLMPLWLVGSQTEEAARMRGFQGAAYVAPNAVSLVLEMGKQRKKDCVVYLAGRNRKSDIETALSVMEQSIEVVEVYEARSVDNLEQSATKAFTEDSIDAVLHYSRRSASLFIDVLRGVDFTARALHVCLSDDVAVPLREAGCVTRTAVEPNEAALIAALDAN